MANQNLERVTDLPYPPEQVYAWHARPGAFQRLVPPWQRVELRRSSGDFAHLRAELRTYLGPFWQTWIAQHSDHQEGRQFVDTQQSGPFASWVHRHRFEPAAAGSQLVDRVTYALPLAPLSQPLLGWFFEGMLKTMFDFRHARTALDLKRHAVWGQEPRMRIAVSGASGLLGQPLCAYLSTAGHTVLKLVRRPSADPTEITWDPRAGTVDLAKLQGVDAVIHLAGENVGEGRWTPERKAELMASRVQGTRTLATALAQLNPKPKVLISASASGFYGDSGEAECDEASPAGQLYLADICKAWEEAAQPAREAGIRVVHPRIGAVVSARGGMLGKLLLPFKLGGGGPVGSGKQYLPWIAIEDVLGALEWLLHRQDAIGPVNLVAPQQIRQGEFAQALGKVLHRPALLPLPAAAVKLMFGQMGQEVLLAGQRVAPRRLQELGFTWAYPQIEDALRAELGIAG
jgi:uncharacterized protein (TIGR01777 family)